MKDRLNKDEKTGRLKNDPPTTGHEWDGIREFENPDPFWLRVLFYIMLFFSLVYWLMYPSFPSQWDRGALNWTQYKETSEDLTEIQKVRDTYLATFNKASFEEILNDETLLKFAIAGGRSSFNNNCVACHGFEGRGNRGYPNLSAGAWIWGGKPEDLYTTIKYGIRSGHEEARESQMPAFGRDGLLTHKEIETLVNYVMGLRKGIVVAEGEKLFADNCVVCHGDNGNREVGAPNLKSAVALYGTDHDAIYDVIYNGRQGVMPFWTDKLSDATIRQLVIYVHQLGGGE